MTEWKTYKLGNICDYVTSRTTRIENYISTENMLPNKGGVCAPSNMPSGTAIEYKVGDILISNIRPYFQKIWQADCNGACSADVLCIRANNKADSKYLYYLLSQQLFFDYVMLGAKGCKMPRGDKKQIMQWQISLPPLPEQRRIAGILGAIDDKIENNRRINTNLELQARALYKQWFVDNRSDDWEEIKLGDIIEISKKSITPSQSENTIFEHYSLPAFDDGIQPVFEKGKDIKSSKFIVEQNMFLFSKLNPRIKRIWLPNIQTENAICSTEFIPYKPKDGAMFGFCYSIVNSDSFYEYVLSLTNGSTGSHQRFHPIDTLDYELTIPNNDYIAKFKELVMPIYRTIARNRMECKNLATLRDTLLPKLMNGEIDVSFD